MMHEIEEVEGEMLHRTAIRKIDIRKMDQQLDRLWALHDQKASEKVQVPQQEAWKINLDEITFKELIQKDDSAEVYRGVYQSRDVIVTVFERSEKVRRAISNGNNSVTGRRPFRQKVSLWHKIDHPNILKLLGARIDEPEFEIRTDDDEVHRLSNMSYLVVDYLCGDTLRSFLAKNRENKLSFKLVIELALHLARGLAHLHSKQLIHGNVKPENLLLDRNLKLTITEFETSNMAISDDEDLISDSQTIFYMAPEVIDSKPYDKKSDVYSFGICLWEIYCCDMPYPDVGFSELSIAICIQNLRPQIPKQCPKGLADLMRQCWDKDPAKRPEMEQVVSMLEALNPSKGKKSKFIDAQSCFCFRPIKE